MLDRVIDMVKANDLFEGFDLSEVNAIRSNYQSELEGAFNARSIARQSKIETRIAESDKKLLDLLPLKIEPGTSFHVLSGGDIDALSYLRVIFANTGYFKNVTISSWRISMAAMQQLHAWMDAGLIDCLNLVVDRRFARLSLDVLDYAKSFIYEYSGNISVTLTHAKITLLENPEKDIYYVLESSANLNINKRLEHTTIYNDKGLHDFYRDNMRYIAEKSDAP